MSTNNKQQSTHPFYRNKGEATGPTVVWRVPEWFPDLSASEKTMLKVFFDELLLANKTLSLIGLKTIPLADLLHFGDSVLSCRVIGKVFKGSEIYDFGSGAGLPGVVFAILYPKVRVFLVEADKPKVAFLQSLVQKLGLKNVEVLGRTVESLPEKSVRFAMARGFSPISKSILAARKCFVKGGTFFHIKGEEWASEVGAIPTQLCSFWLPGLVEEYRLPVGEVRFAVVKTDKVND